MDEYELIQFDDINEQSNFIKSNTDRIVDLLTKCFPPNEQGQKQDDIMMEYRKYFVEHVILLSELVKWFCVIYKENQKIIGFCFIIPDSITYYDFGIDNTYKILNLPDKEYEKIKSNEFTLNITIQGLCKDKDYKNVGSFLLDEVCKYYKKQGVSTIYLTPESTNFKNNYMYYIKKEGCLFDAKKYREGSKKLIKYYEDQGFKIHPKLYIILKCNDDKKSNTYNGFVVMYKNLA